MNHPQQANSDTTPLRPPLVSLCFAISGMYLTYVLHDYGRYGMELASVGCLITGGLALGQVKRALGDAGKLAKLRKQNREFANLDAQFGESRPATADEVEQAEGFSDSHGIFLGQIATGNRKQPWRDVYDNSAESIAVIAPPGQSKTTGIVIPTCLSNSASNLVINDVSGELVSIVGPALEKQGYTVHLVTPFPREVSSLIGREVKDVGLDVFSSMRPDMPADSIRGSLHRCFRWVMPPRSNSEAKDEFFLRSARSIGSFFAMREMLEGRKPTLPAIRRQVMAGMGALPSLCEGSPSGAFGGVYEETARSLATLLEKAPQQLAGGWGIAEQCLDPFDDSSAMGRHTAGSTLDPRVLKTDEKVAVIVVYTLEYFAAYPAPLAMTLTYLLDTVASAKGKRKVLGIIDEAGALNMPLADTLNFYRKANLRCILVFQDLVGQTEKIYGKATTKQILAACKLKIAMGIEEPETLSMFSTLCGTKSVATINQHERHGVAQVIQDPTRSFSHQSAPFLRPEEIRLLKEILVVGGALPPILLRKVRYWERPEWRAAAGPSPFHQGDQDGE